MDIYQLHLVTPGVDPRWLVEGPRARGAVEGNQVSVDGRQLEVCGCRTATGAVRRAAVGLTSGTLVEVWRDANGLFLCARAEEVDIVRASRVAREAADEATLRAREEKRRVRAQAFNASLAVPFRWVPAVINDESGSLEEISGDEARRSTNDVHVLLEQDFRDGRLLRSAGDLLCMRSRRGEGQHLQVRKAEAYAEVSCKECLAVVNRWRSN